jgi:hypothetical protein
MKLIRVTRTIVNIFISSHGNELPELRFSANLAINQLPFRPVVSGIAPFDFAVAIATTGIKTCSNPAWIFVSTHRNLLLPGDLLCGWRR